MGVKTWVCVICGVKRKNLGVNRISLSLSIYIYIYIYYISYFNIMNKFSFTSGLFVIVFVSVHLGVFSDDYV